MILQTIKDEVLFDILNRTIPGKKVESIIYYILHDFDYDEQFLIYNGSTKTLYLCEIETKLQKEILDNNYFKVDKIKLFNYKDYEHKEFIKLKVLSIYQLPKKLNVPELDKTYYLIKPIHERLHADLLTLAVKNPEIYNVLQDSKYEDDGVLAYKKEGKWGFLYYTKKENEDYKFIFEPVNNFVDGKRLNPSNEGYRDFTYFIKSQSLPKAYKIGRAENPDERLKTIQAYNARDVIIDLLLADGRLESYFHSKFEHLRISDSREWFEMGEDLLDFIYKEKTKIKHILKIYKGSL